MVKKLLIILILIGIFISGCSSQSPSDCKENQYYDASKGRCKKIINECYTDEDCSGDETCERKVIRTHMACKLGEECPKWYHNVCELTEETKKYCEQDSDCVWAVKPNSCC